MNIKRKIREELNKQLITEAPACVFFVAPQATFPCPEGTPDQPPQRTGWTNTWRDTSCNWHTQTGGCGGKIDTGGSGETFMKKSKR